MIFAEVPVGATFIDNFDVGDTWIKVDEQRAKVVKGRESGPNMFREGEVDEIKPSWGILSLISNKDETTLTNQDEKIMKLNPFTRALEARCCLGMYEVLKNINDEKAMDYLIDAHEHAYSLGRDSVNKPSLPS